MSVTSGFFNSENGDRKYNAEHFGSIFAGIIRDGVFANYPNTGDELKVTVVSGAMKVQVGPGRCWFKNTWLDNNSNLQFNVPAADSNQARTDAVVVDVNLTNKVRKNDIEYITGQLGGGNPTLANGDGHYQYVLAYVNVPAGATAPTVVGQVGVNKPTPYITGPLQTVSADNVLAQWRDAVNNQITSELSEYLNDDGSKLYEKIETEADRVMPLVVAFIVTNQGAVMSSHDGDADEIRTALHESKPVYGFLQYPDRNDPTIYDPEYFSTVDIRETSNGMGGKSTVEFYFFDRNNPFDVIVCGYDGVAEDTPYLLTRELSGSNADQPIVATFQSSPVSCDISYADLAAAIQAKKDIIAVYTYRIATRTYTIYASSIGIANNVIGIEFALPTGKGKFEYSSSGSITYNIEYSNLSPLVITFANELDGTSCDTEFDEVIAAHNIGRLIIAKMQTSTGECVTTMYEAASDSTSISFYFTAITPDGGTNPASYAHKCYVYRYMATGAVYYSGN